MPDLRENPMAALMAEAVRRERLLQDRLKKAGSSVGLFIRPQQGVPELKRQVTRCACSFGGDF